MSLKQLTLFSQSQTSLLKRSSLQILKKGFGPINDDRISFFTLRGALLLIIINLSLLVFVWRRLPPEVPLFYSLPRGESQLAKRLFLWLLPLGNLFIFSLNLILANKFFTKERLLAQILILTTGITSFLSTVALIKIIFLAI